LVDPGWQYSKDYALHQNFLRSCGIAVPTFFAVDEKQGCLLMEDLGDELLQERISKYPQKKGEYIKLAATTLASLHGKTCPVPMELPVSKRSFDTEKYMEEFAFTLQHLGGLLKQSPASQKDMAIIKDFCKHLSGLGPIVFCHRDYHTRNLFMKDKNLYMIDFQDARMGPPHYDLASLLYDSYVSLSENERDEVEAVYKTGLGNYPLYSQINWESFRTDTRSIAFQRSLKAAGSFASFYTRQKKKTHLAYIEPALSNALILMSRLMPELRAIQRVFDPAALLKKWREIEKSL